MLRSAFLFTLISLGNTGLLRRFFHGVDTDNDGVLSAPELQRYFVEHGAAHLGADDHHDDHMNAIYEREHGLGEAERFDTARAPGAGLQRALRRVLAWLDRTHGDGDGVVRLGDMLALAGNRVARRVADGDDVWGVAAAPPASAPQQVWLALTGEPSEMRVTWVTADAVPSPELQWRSCDGGAGPPAAAAANSSSYSVPARWWEPDAWKGWIHTAVMTNLTPGHRYNYTVTSGAADQHVASQSFVFSALRAPPAAGDVGAGTQIACFGDMGTIMPLGSAVARQLIASHGGPRGAFDAVLHFGDVSYAGTDTTIAPLNISSADEWEFIWDLFGAQMEPIASVAPYLVGVGNHEAWYNFTAFRHRFNMPAERSGGNGNFWWSVDVGLVHVLSFSTEHDFRVGTEQYAWIERDLAKADANRAAVPWIVFSGHRPWLAADMSGHSSHIPGAILLETLEPLFFKYGVDLTLAGHQHCYERVHPNRNGTVLSLPDPSVAAQRVQYTAPRGPVHVVQGSAGALQDEKWMWPPPAWSAARLANGHNNVSGSGGPEHYESTFGFGRLHATNATHLRYMFEPLASPPDGAGAISDASLQDDFWIVKF